MVRAFIALACVLLAGCVSGCNTLKDVTSNADCVTKITLRGSYGTGIPSGSYTASATCNPKGAGGLGGIPPAPPAEDKTPTP